MENAPTGTIEEVLLHYSGKWLVLEIVRHDPPALEPQEVRVVAVADDCRTAYGISTPDPRRHIVAYAPTPERRDVLPIVIAS